MLTDRVEKVLENPHQGVVNFFSGSVDYEVSRLNHWVRYRPNESTAASRNMTYSEIKVEDVCCAGFYDEGAIESKVPLGDYEIVL